MQIYRSALLRPALELRAAAPGALVAEGLAQRPNDLRISCTPLDPQKLGWLRPVPTGSVRYQAACHLSTSGVFVRAHEMERDVKLIAYHPAVVTWPDGKEIACR